MKKYFIIVFYSFCCMSLFAQTGKTGIDVVENRDSLESSVTYFGRAFYNNNGPAIFTEIHVGTNHGFITDYQGDFEYFFTGDEDGNFNKPGYNIVVLSPVYYPGDRVRVVLVLIPLTDNVIFDE